MKKFYNTPVADESTSREQSGDESGDGEEEDDEKVEEQFIFDTFKVTDTTHGVKVLGVRNLSSDSYLRMDWSCSGAEFAIDLKGGDISFDIEPTDPCYFRFWIDGKEYSQNGSVYFTAERMQPIVLTDVSVGKHTVKMMKVTGYTLARAKLKSIAFAGSMLTDVVDTSDKELYIEFIGDSITCGYGTIGNINGNKYTDQDGTVAYSYLLAEALDADYSMTALSGHKLIGQMDSMYLYTSHLVSMQHQYDFARKADIVVINLGTNDVFKGESESDFKEAYISFLKTVKEKNGEKCKILCLYNAMNDTFSGAILEAVVEVGGANRGISTYKLARAAGDPGKHPSVKEHEAYAEALLPIIKSCSSQRSATSTSC